MLLMDFVHISIGVSLSAIVVILGGGILVSVIHQKTTVENE